MASEVTRLPFIPYTYIAGLQYLYLSSTGDPDLPCPDLLGPLIYQEYHLLTFVNGYRCWHEGRIGDQYIKHLNR